MSVYCVGALFGLCVCFFFFCVVLSVVGFMCRFVVFLMSLFVDAFVVAFVCLWF